MTETPAAELVIDSKRVGDNGTFHIVAQLGGDTIAAEKIDILKPKQRDNFAARLCDGRPGVVRAEIDAELLRLAGEAAKPKAEAAPAAESPEIELSSVVRPELFHAPDVSGITVAVLSALGSEATARWFTYLRWADGRRERRELASTIEFPGGARLWIHPVPADPTPTMAPGWSAAGRWAWLQGALVPSPTLVFKALCERIAWFLDFPPESAAGMTATIALWVMFTYAFPAWPAVPYLAVGGPKGSGKTTLFGVLSRLCFRALQSSNMTAACLFRTLHEQGGTLLLDEAERLRDGTPDASDLRSILLSGYKPGSPAMRLEKTGDSFTRQTFDVFGPKAVASIANPPEALADRSLRLTMFRAAPDSPKPRRRFDADATKWQSIRDDLHALTLEHGPTWLALAGRADVVPADLAGREYELWQPMLALAAWLDDAGARGLLAMMQGHALGLATEGREDSTPDADEALLRIVSEHVAAGSHCTLKASDVLRRANELDPATFGKWSARGVGAALARYGLRTAKQHGCKGRTFHKVTVDALRRVEAAYGLDLDLPSADVPHVPQRTAGGVSAVENAGTSDERIADRGTCGTSRYVANGGET